MCLAKIAYAYVQLHAHNYTLLFSILAVNSGNTYLSVGQQLFLHITASVTFAIVVGFNVVGLL